MNSYNNPSRVSTVRVKSLVTQALNSSTQVKVDLGKEYKPCKSNHSSALPYPPPWMVLDHTIPYIPPVVDWTFVHLEHLLSQESIIWLFQNLLDDDEKKNGIQQYYRQHFRPTHLWNIVVGSCRPWWMTTRDTCISFMETQCFSPRKSCLV